LGKSRENDADAILIYISAYDNYFIELFEVEPLWLGSCFSDFSSFSYFFLEFFQLLGWIRELFCGFLLFQLLFFGIFPDFGLD
jgi:hypothetical protein